jgi:hypothetical protein
VDLAHDPQPLVAVKLVDVELPMQMVCFVLEAPGKLTRSGHDDLLLLKVHARHDGTVRPLPECADARNGQAALNAVSIAAQFDDPGVDQVAKLAVHVVGERGQAGADLIGGHARTPRLLDRVEQVLDQAGECIVEPRHRIARGAQHRVAEIPQRPDGHDLTCCPPSAVSLPSRSRTS